MLAPAFLLALAACGAATEPSVLARTAAFFGAQVHRVDRRHPDLRVRVGYPGSASAVPLLTTIERDDEDGVRAAVRTAIDAAFAATLRAHMKAVSAKLGFSLGELEDDPGQDKFAFRIRVLAPGKGPAVALVEPWQAHFQHQVEQEVLRAADGAPVQTAYGIRQKGP